MSNAPFAESDVRADLLTTIPVDSDLKEVVHRVRLVVFDFDGVFTDNAVLVSETGTEFVRCWRGDGLGLRELEKLGLDLVILSTEENTVVTARSRKLKIHCVQGCRDKRASLELVAAERGVDLSEIAFVGNDINDLECLRAVALPIVVRDAHADVLHAGRLRTGTPGGHGAVREVCDFLCRVLRGAE